MRIRNTCITKELIKDGFLKVFKLIVGEQTFELMERPDCASVLLHDKDGNVALLTQFRPGALEHDNGKHVIELAAGMIDQGESPSNAAIREVQEETGSNIEEDQLQFLGTYYLTPGGSNERTHLFLAQTDLSLIDTSITHGLKEENESIAIMITSLDEAISLAKSQPSNITLITALQALKLSL